MSKGFRLVTMVALSLVLLVGISLVGCEEEEEEALQNLDVELYQYLKGATVDMDDATLNSMAEGGGEGGANSMGMAYAGLDLPPCKDYADLTADQKEAVSAWLVAFLGRVDTGIEAYTNGSVADLTGNEAYTTLHNLSGMGWFGKWAQGVGVTSAWTPQDAFWATWPDPAGRGGQCEFMDWVTANGLATVTGNTAYTWTAAGEGAKYAEQTAANRALIDADLAAFLATMQADADAANQAVTDAFTAEIQSGNWPDAFDAAMAAYIAVLGAGGTADEAAAAFQGELMANWPVAFAACVAAGTPVMMGVVMASEAFVVLKTLGKPAADGWAADIELDVHPRQAFFRWIAKPAVMAMAAAGVLVELSVGEFSFKITNPNEYFVSIDNMSINISVNADGTAAFGDLIAAGYMEAFPALDVDAAKLAVGDKMWIPAADEDGNAGEVIVKLSAPIKWLDMVTWMVMAGYDGDTAGAYAMDVWARIHLLGTAVFDVTIEATISSEEETITQSFTLTWTPAS